MKNSNLILVVFLSLLLSFCHTDEELDNPEVPTTPNIEKSASTTGTTDNPNRSYYDVVVLDIDRWEICLKLVRARYHCNSYEGHLWYQQGAFVIEGYATAVYNHSLDMLAVTAYDAGWDKAHICYSMQFIEGTNDLYGSFVYREYPRRTNGITAWLVQGQLGPHIYGLTKSTFEEEAPIIPLAHPKKVRFEKDIE